MAPKNLHGGTEHERGSANAISRGMASMSGWYLKHGSLILVALGKGRFHITSLTRWQSGSGCP